MLIAAFAAALATAPAPAEGAALTCRMFLDGHAVEDQPCTVTTGAEGEVARVDIAVADMVVSYRGARNAEGVLVVDAVLADGDPTPATGTCTPEAATVTCEAEVNELTLKVVAE